jgi:hypothetical protein
VAEPPHAESRARPTANRIWPRRPRAPDGKPDLSGLWNKVSPKYSRNVAADLKPEEIQPWARALVEQRAEDLGKEYMNVKCVPLGPGYAISADNAPGRR